MSNKPSDDDKKTYQIGFYVEVEIDAIDEFDAIHLAQSACGWPGHYEPPLQPCKHTYTTGRGDVYEVQVTRNTALMVKEIDPDG